MRLTDIIRLTRAHLAAGDEIEGREIKNGFSSDLMSDVLTLDTEHMLLITGLANIQLIRTAEMADIEVVLLARNKKATPDMIELAKETGLVIIETPYSIFRASGILYENGLEPVY
ncbi:MAG TPA: hypothetical protein PK335_07700 [Draconibacterium sp.]|nr:hypothetical protein [Draconibacterium sp.]